MIETCPTKADLIEEEIDHILTQYRESPYLIGLMRNLLGQVADVATTLCSISTYFDLDTAVGEQLTFIGKRMGFPRCHCVCITAPVFGFDCGPGVLGIEIVGLCEGGTWINCDDVGTGTLCLYDDDVYRGYLYARRYQMMGLYDIESLKNAAQHLWGAAAWVVEAGFGRVVVAPGRDLTAEETSQLAIAFRVLPIAPGIKGFVHQGDDPIFGFGFGWHGFCETPEAVWLCETDPHAYDCAS